jgi:hypothetical protein
VPALLSVRVLTAALVVGLTAVSLPATAVETPFRSPVTSEASQAEKALGQAKALFAGTTTVRARKTAQEAGGGPDATLALRDLALRVDDLPTAAQRETANRLLARPTTDGDPTGGLEPKYTSPSGSTCGAHVCVHWVEDDSEDAVQTGNDGDLATVPAQATTTLTTLESVYNTEVGRLGYRAPLGDGTLEGNARTDVYLADLGSDGLYGYCTSDDPRAATSRTVFAYCVVDNDYRAAEYGTAHTSLENLQVTAAHEFFHAIQFAYDWTEDAWFMEGTAAWIEDEIYDGVDDNLQYLGQSPMTYPGVPLDYTDRSYLPYGSWVFWKFLSEWQGARRTDDPSVVRNTWEQAAGTAYSAAALQRVLVSRRSSFASAFQRFGTWSRNPMLYFSEGSTYQAAPLARSFSLTRSHRSTGDRVTVPDHMTHRFYRVTPGTTLRGFTRLKVSVNMANISRGSAARVVTHRRNGTVSAYSVPLGRYGNGVRWLGFRRSVVKYLEVELVNSSIRFDCGQRTTLSCSGAPYDDNLRAVFRASAMP